MKQSKKAILLMVLLSFLTLSLFATGDNEEQESASPEVIAVEYWNEHNQYGIMDAEHPQAVFLAKKFGMYFEAPLVPFNGGSDYLQTLRLRIAAGDMPDVFLPWGGIESEIIANGAAYDLTDLVKEEMPVYWSMLSDQVRETVLGQSPSGDKLNYLPQIDFTPLAGFIRGDWLDNLGLDIPTTTEEYTEVLRAFRDNDANGNGDPGDEIPTSGREGARWMDHLFAPFGIAMKEGYPQWDTYNGRVEYSAIQPEMKAAIAWLRELYAEKLLDPETFVNTNNVWKGKITGNILGSWYHGAHWQGNRVESMVTNGDTDARVDFLPVLKANGYDGFYTATEYRRPALIFSSEMSEEAVRRTMRALEYINKPSATKAESDAKMLEGADYKMVDGERVLIDIVKETSNHYRYSIGNDLLNVYPMLKLALNVELDALKAGGEASAVRYESRVNQLSLVNAYVEAADAGMTRQIRGQWLASDIWEGYPDLMGHKLYQEYVANIVIGNWSIDKFDEFVQKWKEQGGDEVTRRVQEYFDGLN